MAYYSVTTITGANSTIMGIHLVRCNFFKLLKVGLPLSKRFLKLSISFTNCAIFHEKLGFEVNYAKSQHRRISEALQRKWGL